MDITSILAVLWGLILVIVIVAAGIQFLISFSLFTICKKLGIKSAWVAFVPFFGYFMFHYAARVKILTYAVLPILLWYGVNVFSWVAPVIDPSWTLTMLSGLLAFWFMIVSIYCWVHTLWNLSKRTGHGIGMTVGLFFLTFIFLPIIAFGKMNIQEENENSANESSTLEAENEEESEKKEEL